MTKASLKLEVFVCNASKIQSRRMFVVMQNKKMSLNSGEDYICIMSLYEKKHQRKFPSKTEVNVANSQFLYHKKKLTGNWAKCASAGKRKD